MEKLGSLKIGLIILGLFIVGFFAHVYLMPESKPSYSPATVSKDKKETTTAIDPFAPSRKPDRSASSLDDTHPTKTSQTHTGSSSRSAVGDSEPLPQIFWGYLKLIDTTFFGHNHAQNRAIIKDLVTFQEASYSLNSIIPYGSRLIKIMKERIILEMDGQTRTMKLSASLDNKRARKALLTKGYQQVTENEWLIRPNRLLENDTKIDRLLHETQISPYFVKGTQRFRVDSLKEGSVIEQLGISKGDIFRTVNGEEITQIKDLLSAYWNVRNSALITIDLERDHQPISLSYQIIPDEPPSYNIENILNSSEVAGFAQ